MAAAGQDGAVTEVNGILGESVTFPLKLRSPQEVENIAWTSLDLSVAFVQPNPGEVGPQVSVTHQSFRGRINVLSDSCDLVISHLRPEDSRVYTAYINSKHGTDTRRFSLSVFRESGRPPSAPTSFWAALSRLPKGGAHLRDSSSQASRCPFPPPGRLGTATITRSVTPTQNGTCNVTLTCWVEGGENVSFTWTPPGTGPTLFLSHGPERLEGAVTCTARNPVSSTNASVDAESLCTGDCRTPAAPEPPRTPLPPPQLSCQGEPSESRPSAPWGPPSPLAGGGVVPSTAPHHSLCPPQMSCGGRG